MEFLNEKNIRFFKLSALILGPGNSVVTNNLSEKVRAEQLTFPEFLNKKKHELFHMYKKGLCHLCLPDANNRKYGKGLSECQWNILFHKTRQKCKNRKVECCCIYDAEVNITEEDLDISLTVCLLINLFRISIVEKHDLHSLREQRNLFAHANKESLDIEENDFRCKLNKLVSAIKTISCHRTEFHDKICKEIEDIEKSSSQHDMCYQMIIDWIQESHIDVLKSNFEKALKDFLHDIKEMQEKENVYRKQGISHSQTCNKKLQKKFEKKIKEYKSFSVHGELQTKRSRPALIKKNSKSLPTKFKVLFGQRSKDLPHIESLKSDERNLLSNILHLCKIGSLEEIEEIMSDISWDCLVLRTRDEQGYCAIHYASNRDGENAIRIIEVLTNHGAELDDPTWNGMTVLHFACHNGNVALCNYCLTVDSTTELLNMEDNRGWSAPLFAAFCGHTQVLKCLKETNRKIKTRSDRTGENILHLACLAKNTDIYFYIMNTFPGLKREKDNEGRTVVHYIARGGNTDILEDLTKSSKKHGSKSFLATEWVRNEFKRSHNKRNPLHISCIYGHEEMSRYIISKFPNMLHEVDEDGLHAVYYAAVGGNVSLMSFLIEILNDSVHRLTISGKKINILQIACIYEKTEIAIFIAKTFPYLRLERDHDGWLIQHLAAKCGNLEFLKFLVEEKPEELRHEIDLSSKDNLDRTILHIACLHGNYEICEYILSKFPAMIRERDKDGCLACALAASGGNMDVFNLLLDKSISSLNDDDKRNMFYAAERSGNQAIIQIINGKYSEISSKEIPFDQTAMSLCELSMESETIQSPQNSHCKTSGTVESTLLQNKIVRNYLKFEGNLYQSKLL